jgi:Glycosyl hydrolase family 79 C-terminal beta domain
MKHIFLALALIASAQAQPSWNVALTWTATAGGTTPPYTYVPYKAVNPCPATVDLTQQTWTALPSTTSTTATDTSVVLNSTDCYMVETVDASGVNSSPSNTTQVTIPAAAPASGPIAVAVNLAPVLTIPSNFVGISEPHGDIADLGVVSPAVGLNAAYYNLLKNLTIAGVNPLEIRVEGDLMSPTAILPGVNGGMPQEPQTTVLPVLQRMGEEGWMHFILGVDLASNQPAWAAVEVQAYLKNVPAAKIDAFEIGNEPDNYLGQGYRIGAYGAPQFLADWSTWRAAMVKAAGKPLVFEGPAAAGSSFEAATIAAITTTFPVGIYGQHAYIAGNSTANAPDLLLQPAASVKIAGLYGKYAPQVAPIPYRISEMNSVSGGGQAGLSNTFQSTLWLIDTAFNEAAAGMAGFNFHTGQYTAYNLWEFSASPQTVNGITARQLQTVNPPYYAMIVLAGMMGNGARLLSTTSIPADPVVVTWATLDASGNVHVAVINKSETAAATVAVSIPGYATASAGLLTAPSYTASAGITWRGQTFDGSTNGLIQGATVKYPVQAKSGVFTVNVPITSAVVLTVAP